MKIRYTCKFTFSDPEDNFFNHVEYVKIILPESTYLAVKEYAFEYVSKLNLDLPEKYSKIDFEISKQEKVL